MSRHKVVSALTKRGIGRSEPENIQTVSLATCTIDSAFVVSSPGSDVLAACRSTMPRKVEAAIVGNVKGQDIPYNARAGLDPGAGDNLNDA